MHGEGLAQESPSHTHAAWSFTGSDKSTAWIMLNQCWITTTGFLVKAPTCSLWKNNKNYMSNLQQNQSSEWTCLTLSEILSFLCVICKIYNVDKQCFNKVSWFVFQLPVWEVFVRRILAKAGHAEKDQEKKLLLENISDTNLVMAQSSKRSTSQLWHRKPVLDIRNLYN